MGLGKSLKKAVKKVTKVVSKATIGGAAGLLGGGNEGGGAAVVEAAPVNPAASVVEAPKDSTDANLADDTEAAKKSARAKGKRGLQVARSSGTGLNV